MNTSNVDQARRILADAEAALQEALDLEAKEKRFILAGEVFVVMERRPQFDQFVSYSEDGRIAGIFTTEVQANLFRDTMPVPAGYSFVVETVPLHV